MKPFCEVFHGDARGVVRGDIPHDLRIKVAAVLVDGGFSVQILFQHELQRTDDGVQRRFLRNGCRERVAAHFQQRVARDMIFLRKPDLAFPGGKG